MTGFTRYWLKADIGGGPVRSANGAVPGTTSQVLDFTRSSLPER